MPGEFPDAALSFSMVVAPRLHGNGIADNTVNRLGEPALVNREIIGVAVLQRTRDAVSDLLRIGVGSYHYGCVRHHIGVDDTLRLKCTDVYTKAVAAGLSWVSCRSTAFASPEHVGVLIVTCIPRARYKLLSNNAGETVPRTEYGLICSREAGR